MAAERPHLISWADQFRADVAAVENDFARARRTFVALLDKPLATRPGLIARLGTDVAMDPSAPFSQRAELEMTATSQEVSLAPEAMRKLFADLGVVDGDEVAVLCRVARRDSGADARKYAESVYGVTLVPTAQRENQFGVKFTYWPQQWWFLKPGTPINETEGLNLSYHDARIRNMADVYYLLGEGMVYESYEEGTHAAITKYRQKPHPYLARIHRNAADWITTLVDSRAAS